MIGFEPKTNLNLTMYLLLSQWHDGDHENDVKIKKMLVICNLNQIRIPSQKKKNSYWSMIPTLN